MRAITASANSLGSNFLFADAFGVDVVGVDAVFDRAQPRVVRELGRLALADVHEHQQRAVQQTRGVGHVLSPARRGAEPWIASNIEQ